METFTINLITEDFILKSERSLLNKMKKLLRVIKSMNNQEQIPATRRYIDLWYKMYGTKNKQLIEIYFKSKKNEVR
jgi:hypothetical protein